MVNTIDSLNPTTWVSSRPPGTGLIASLRAWLSRHRSSRASEARFDELVELDAHLLADIGAPDHLLCGAMARRESQRDERDGLRIGLAAGAWHHW